MRMLISYCVLLIFLLFLLASYSSGDLVYKANYTWIMVEKGASVVLNCTCSLSNESSWTGPKISTILEMDKNDEEIYTAGFLLNPKLFDLNIAIIGNNESDKCSLVIRNFSEVGVGNYMCEYRKSGIVYIHNFTVQLKIPPNNLTFLNTFESRQEKHIPGIEGRKLNVICTLNNGKPPETLYLKDNGSTVQSGENGKIVYSFVPSRKDNLKSIECYAVSAMLDRALTDTVILDIQYKPSLIIDHIAREKLIENTTTKVCCQGNSNSPMDQIKWKGNVNHIDVNNTTSCLTFSPIHRTDTQRYICVASNIIGVSESHIDIKVMYPPVVSVSYTITEQTINLQCHPEGLPTNYTFAKWYFRSEFKENSRKIKGTQTGNLTIKAQSNKTLFKHVGIYVCRVSNGVKARNGNLYQEGAVTVHYEDRPETPNNLTVVQYENHIIVSWIPGFNGGFNQLFFIQYRNVDTEWWTISGPIQDSLENKIQYTIYDLVSTAQYCVYVF